MKIALLSPGGFDMSGRERIIPVFVWLVERLARTNEVHVIVLNQYPQAMEYPLHGATVHNIGYRDGERRALRQWKSVIAVLNHLNRQGRFDVIHGLWASNTGLMSAFFGRRYGVPSIVTVAGGELVGLRSIGYGSQIRIRDKWIVNTSLRLAGRVTCASEYMLQMLRAWRQDALKIVLGVDSPSFEMSDVPPKSPWRLVHVANLNRVKDQPTLIRAFAKIRSEERESSLDIVGLDTLSGEIQRQATALGLEESVRFHGFEPTEVVASRLKSSHLLLHSSLSEAAGIVVLEAAACGVPTCGTKVGYISDLAPDAAAAVPVGDSDALAATAVDLLRSPERRSQIGMNAHRFALEHDADHTAARTLELYESVVHSR